MRFVLVALLVLSMNCAADEPTANPAARKPIPDRLVVLTFDYSAKSHYTIVRPLPLFTNALQRVCRAKKDFGSFFTHSSANSTVRSTSPVML